MSFIRWLFGLFSRSDTTNGSTKTVEEQIETKGVECEEDTNPSGKSTNSKRSKTQDRPTDSSVKQENGCRNSETNNNTEDNVSKPLETVRINFDQKPEFVKKIRPKSARKDMKPIFGLTVLRNELFIIAQFSKEVEVYDSKTLEFKRQFGIKGLYDPIDIRSSEINNSLFIFDWCENGGEILRIDSSGDLKTKWLTGNDGGFISVTPEGHLLLSVWERNVLKEFSPDGEMIKEIVLTGIEDLKLGVKLSDSEFLLSHGEEDSDDHKVCLVDGRGTVTKSLGGKQGHSDNQFNSPNYFAIDSSGFVLVADQNNKRVLLLSPQLEFKQELIQEKDGLRYPVRIELDKSTGRVFVADCNHLVDEKKWMDGSVMIFDFKTV